MKKNILAIAPIMPKQSEIELFSSTLAFLKPHCEIDFIDPLVIIDINVENRPYYLAWQQYLADQLQKYEGFIGFSFGGVILQQCFPLFENKHIPMVLFSTPTFADNALKNKLGEVIHLCENNQVEQALDVLYTDVYYPNNHPFSGWDDINLVESSERLIKGLKRVLDTDSRHLLKTTTVNHIHLIGARSDLVNTQNVIPPKSGQLMIVPNAGMRVLQDNAVFCKQVIMDELRCENE